MIYANEGSKPYVLPTHLSTSGVSHACFYSPAVKHQCRLAGAHFRSNWD